MPVDDALTRRNIFLKIVGIKQGNALIQTRLQTINPRKQKSCRNEGGQKSQ
jgi:hypothetical protein